MKIASFVLICLFPVCVVLSACMQPELYRAAPNLEAYSRHVDAGSATEAEAAAVHEYYQAIESGDQKRFIAAKKALADIEGGGK